MLTNENWSQFAGMISYRGDPYLHSPTSIDRLMTTFDDHVYRLPTPHGKYKHTISCEAIQFQNEWAHKTYEAAWLRYVERCRRMRKNPAEGHFARLVATNQFRFAAEVIRAEPMADKCIQHLDDGFAPVIGCNGKRTIARTVYYLVKKHKIPRENISIIWGGDDTLQFKNRLSVDQINEYLMQAVLGTKVPRKIMKQIEFQLAETPEEYEQVEADKGMDLDLGIQSRDERERQKKRFQRGKSEICLFTFAAGGVGLSLHHQEKTEKGEIVHLRPRRGIFAPTYSAQDFVQGLGRVHRTIFSMSDTISKIIFYAGTVEISVMVKVSIKLKALHKCVKSRESWLDAMYDAALVDDEQEQRRLIVGSDVNETVEEEMEGDLNPESEDEDE